MKIQKTILVSRRRATRLPSGGPNEAGRFVYDRTQIVFGFGYAALLAFILYWPWLPVLLDQMRQVQLNYWMAEPDAQIVEETLFTWATGLPYEGALVSRLWLALIALAMMFALWRRPKAAKIWQCCQKVATLNSARWPKCGNVATTPSQSRGGVQNSQAQCKSFLTESWRLRDRPRLFEKVITEPLRNM